MTSYSTSGPGRQSTIVLTRAELARMRGLAGLDEDPTATERKMKTETTKRSLLRSQQRIATIRARDQARAQNTQPSDIEELHKRESEQRLELAQEQRDEDLDEAKYMDSLMKYARTVGIRDRQREEKKLIKQKEKEDDKLWAQLMEEDRVRDLETRRAAEKAKAIERREGAKVVVSQIAQRRLQKEMEKEEIAKEGEQRLKEMERQRQEEIEAAKKKAEHNRQMQEMIVEENRKFLEVKAKQKELDKLEDLKVMEYLKQKAAREAEYEAEQEKKKKALELETARLRSLQEKFIDEQAEKDQLQMKRAIEADERAWRKKTKEEAEKRARMDRETKEARDLQVAQKKALLEDAEQREREEFERIVASQKEEDERERTMTMRQKSRSKQYGDEVRAQIEARRQAAIAKRDAELNEGDDFRRSEKERHERLERLKAKKVEQLRKEGVPEKYIVDLLKVKV